MSNSLSVCLPIDLSIYLLPPVPRTLRRSKSFMETPGLYLLDSSPQSSKPQSERKIYINTKWIK